MEQSKCVLVVAYLEVLDDLYLTLSPLVINLVHGSMRMITWLHKSSDVLDETTLQLIDVLYELIVWLL